MLFFGVSGDKNVHYVLRVELRGKDRALTLREPEKGTSASILFAHVARLRFDKAELVIDWELKPEAPGAALPAVVCYNQFDFDAISSLTQKILNNVPDLLKFASGLKPQLCFVQEKAFTNKSLSPKSEVKVILVERTVIIHEPGEESFPQYLVPLWKRPLFASGKNGISFDMKKKSVDIYFQSEEVRDAIFAAMQVAAQKTPSDSVPLRNKLQSLVQMREMPFEPHNANHSAMAERLWKAAIERFSPGEKMPDTTESDKWKELGFGSASLSTELKISNMLGLVLMVYFAEVYPADFEAIVDGQRNAKPEERFLMAQAMNRVTFMVYSILGLGKRQVTWYPTFVTYPMWNYDAFAFENLVCISMRLFNKVWLASSNKVMSACMNDLIADLTDNLARPPTEPGVPYVFTMFRFLLAKPKADALAKEFITVTEGGGDSSAGGGGTQKRKVVVHTEPIPHPWTMGQAKFLSTWIEADETRRRFLTAPGSEEYESSTISLLVKDSKQLQQELGVKRSERRKLEGAWGAVKESRTQLKGKMLCLICNDRAKAVISIPCNHMVLCRKCTTIGMICPFCKTPVVGFIEAVYDDDTLMTLR